MSTNTFVSSGAEFAFQVSGGSAVFSGSTIGCSSKRTYASGSTLTMPSDGVTVVSIWAGYAYGQSTVYITTTFVLNPATTSMVPTLAPTIATTLQPTVSYFPTLRPGSPTVKPTSNPSTRTGLPTPNPSTNSIYDILITWNISGLAAKSFISKSSLAKLFRMCSWLLLVKECIKSRIYFSFFL